MGYFISRAVVHVITCWRIESYGGRFWNKKNVLLPFALFLPVEYKGGIILTRVCEKMSCENFIFLTFPDITQIDWYGTFVFVLSILSWVYFFRFLGEVMAQQFSFEINWP